VYPEDDAFITYRYVKNLLDGKGLVYNEGQRVMGSTTPLYLFWLAGLKLILPFDIPDLSVRFNLIWFILSAIALARLIRYATREYWLGLAGACFFLLSRRMLTISLGGMESFLFTCLVLWSLERLARGRYLQAALLADLALVTRPEGVFVILICAIAWLKSERRAPILFASLLLGIATLWFTWAWLYFGTPIPHSIIAKINGLYPLPLGDAIKEILLAMGSWTIGIPVLSKPLQTILTLLVATGLVLSMLIWSKSRTVSWSIVSYLSLIVSFYGIGNAYMVSWYYPVIFALYFLILFIGLWCLILNARRIGHLILSSIGQAVKIDHPTTNPTIAIILICVYFTGLTLYPYARLFQSFSIWQSPFINANISRTVTYKQAAIWLDAKADKNVRVAAPEIGALGYFWNGWILDSSGLVSPEALPFLGIMKSDPSTIFDAPISAQFVKATNPDYIVTHPRFARKTLLIDSWFMANYNQVAKFALPEPIWGADSILVFRKNH